MIRFKQHETDFAELAASLSLILEFGFDANDNGHKAMQLAKKYQDAGLHKHNETAELNARKAIKWAQENELI